MYALIYDEYNPAAPMKKVLSVHKSRRTAEIALEKRMRRLGKRVWQCNARIVWVHGRVKARELLNPSSFATWRPGEKIPWGDLFSDAD
jgi:hypothetical protein